MKLNSTCEGGQYYPPSLLVKMAEAPLRDRSWVFTLNNYAPGHLERIAQMPFEWLRYVAYSEEVAPTTGTPHLQGFMYAHENVSLKQCIKFLPGAHWAIMEGSFLQNEAYCSKQGKLVEVGERPMQGRRTDLTMCKRKLDEGMEVMELAQQENYFGHVAKHHKFFEKYVAYKKRKAARTNRDAPEVYVRIGATGKGKSKWLDDKYGLGGWAEVPCNKGQWFDYCDDSDVIVFNDVSPGQVPTVDLFKRLTDRYPVQVPVKGGYITWKPKVIVFTSNHEIIDWWPDIKPVDYSAVVRRITKVEHV